MQFLSAIPALPVRDMQKSIPFYQDVLGLFLRHHDNGFAIFQRDAVELHLWQAGDESWQRRQPHEPVRSGAESFIAGTASCRIALTGVDELYTALQAHGAIHLKGAISDKPWGYGSSA